MKKEEEFLTINFSTKEKKTHGNFRVLGFPDGEYQIAYLPSLNLTAYGDTKEEALDMLINIVVRDYFDHLLALPEHKLMAELRLYGWVRKPFLTKQLRNVKFLDTNTIKENFNLPVETVIHEQYTSA